VIHPNVFHNESLLPIEKVRLSPGQAVSSAAGASHHAAHLRGEAFAYERHWRRLEKDANLTHLPMPYTRPKCASISTKLFAPTKSSKVARASI